MAKKTKRQQPPRRRTSANAQSRSGPAFARDIETLPAGEEAMAAPDTVGGGLGAGETVTGAGRSAGPPTPAGDRPPAAGSVAVGRRRIGRVDPGAPQTGRGTYGRPGHTAVQFEPLDPGDAAIPFDRVPYVRSDLRRVAMMALLMVVIILVAAVVVSNVIK